jgi:hypothetical protein
VPLPGLLPSRFGCPVSEGSERFSAPDAGLLEAARRLAALPESPELWQALRAVLGGGA